MTYKIICLAYVKTSLGYRAPLPPEWKLATDLCTQAKYEQTLLMKDERVVKVNRTTH